MCRHHQFILFRKSHTNVKKKSTLVAILCQGRSDEIFTLFTKNCYI